LNSIRSIYDFGDYCYQGVVRSTYGVENSHTLVSWDRVNSYKKKSDYGYGSVYDYNYGYDFSYLYGHTYNYNARPIIS
jgi:hypothetical protein